MSCEYNGIDSVTKQPYNTLQIGPQTTFKVIGGCSLNIILAGTVFVYKGSRIIMPPSDDQIGGIRVNVNSSFVMYSNTSISAAFVDIVAPMSYKNKIMIYGSIVTQAPLNSSIGSGVIFGDGGSYGGSGGRVVCSNYFAIKPFQIGALTVEDDINLPSAENPTLGASGCCSGPNGAQAGAGGGRIYLKSGSVKLYSTGYLIADGAPSIGGAGAGSGGSVSIVAFQFSASVGSIISVMGGVPFIGTDSPSVSPTPVPTPQPSSPKPTLFFSLRPTHVPTTIAPTMYPSSKFTGHPSAHPSHPPFVPTVQPTFQTIPVGGAGGGGRISIQVSRILSKSRKSLSRNNHFFCFYT